MNKQIAVFEADVPAAVGHGENVEYEQDDGGPVLIIHLVNPRYRASLRASWERA